MGYLARQIALSFCTLLPLHAQDIKVENDYFIVNINGSGSWRNEVDVQQVERITQSAVDYWAGLFVPEQHKAETDAEKIQFELWFTQPTADFTTDLRNIIEFTSLEPDDNMTKLENGLSYNYSTQAERKLRDKNVPLALNPDFDIWINTDANFYYGAEGEQLANSLDFHSILLREISRGLGFASTTFRAAEGGRDIHSTGHISAYDTLIIQNIEDQIPENLTLGTDIFIGKAEEGLMLYNPATWDASASLNSLVTGTDSLMTPQLLLGETKHELSEHDIELFTQMGWFLRDSTIPEPSSSILMLSSLLVILRRRRR